MKVPTWLIIATMSTSLALSLTIHLVKELRKDVDALKAQCVQDMGVPNE